MGNLQVVPKQSRKLVTSFLLLRRLDDEGGGVARVCGTRVNAEAGWVTVPLGLPLVATPD